MTWNIFVVLIIVFIGLCPIQGIYDQPDFWITVAALVLSVAMLIMLYVTRKFELVAIISGIAGSIVCQVNIFTVLDGERFIDLLWIVVIAIYLFYVVGVKWGAAALVLNFIGFLVFLFVVQEGRMTEALVLRDSNTQFTVILNSVITIAVLCYLLVMMQRVNRHAERQFKEINTRLQSKNDEVSAQHEEKSVLLKEIHHRVKNNLQIISSMLKLQAGESTNDETQDQLGDAVSRIRSMALIHEKMYGSTDLARIKLKDYLQSLMQEVIQANAELEKIDLNITSEIEHVSINHLVPLALIMNELATNSLKHGFENQSSGTISIAIERKPEGVHLRFSDNGQWKPGVKSTGFGTMIVQTLSEQLEGSFERSTTDGTHYHFQFADLK